MDLKDLLPNKQTIKRECYWSLVMEPGWIQAGVWYIDQKKAEVVSLSPPAAWASDEELTGACDTALSAAVQNLPDEVEEPTKTVFGVPSSWVEEGQIKKEFLDKIKRICTDLSLTPAGFVVLPEAIAYYIKSEEGTPLNGIVIGIGDQNLELAVFNLGNLAGMTVVSRSVSVADDVLEGLVRFGSGDPLPSRFILFDGKAGDLEDVRQNLIGSDWQTNEKVKFLHTPKVEIFEPDKKVLATALAGASEIAEVTKVESVTGFEKTEEFTETKEPEVIEEEAGNLGLPEDNQITAEDVGFVIGQDVALDSQSPALAASPDFVSRDTSPAVASERVFEEPRPAMQPSDQPLVKKSFAKNFSPSFLKGILGKFKFSLPKPKIHTANPFAVKGARAETANKVFLMGGIILLLLLVSGVAFWWYYPKAVVTIYVSPQSLKETVSLTVDTEADSPVFDQLILPGRISEAKVTGEKTKSTTGTKTIGDKAKGSVKIQNGTGNIINLPAGTVITAANSLKFTTGSAASISAALSPSSPGTATVEVTADSIGADYNLAKDESFKVGNYPKAEVDAVAMADFSGGSSRQISAVSQDDRDVLESQLEDELIAQAKEELITKLGENEYFIEGSVESEVEDRTFSHKVGDEASSLDLSMQYSVKGLVISKSDLNKLASEALKSKVPSGHVLREEQISVSFNYKGNEDDGHKIEVAVSANLLPEIKSSEIAQKISGKNPQLAQEYLNTLPGFSQAEVRLMPKFPGKLAILPKVVKNIEIEVSAQR